MGEEFDDPFGEADEEAEAEARRLALIVPWSPAVVTEELGFLGARVDRLESKVLAIELRLERKDPDLARVEEKIDRLWRWLNEDVESVLDLEARVVNSIILTEPD